jgi:hypothetical protein
MRIKERTVSGARAFAKSRPECWTGGPAPFGYTVNCVVEGIRKTAYLLVSDAATIPHPRLSSQKLVVIYIYKCIAAGASTREVSDYLNFQKIPAGKNKAATRWVPGRIRNIVLELIYKGTHFYERNEVYRDPDDVLRRPHYRPAPREKWIARAVPAIVTEKLWEQANAALKANASLAHSHTDREYLLTGLIQCGYCGQRKLIATTLRNRTYYRCGRRKANYNASGVACKSPHVLGGLSGAVGVGEEAEEKEAPLQKRLERLERLDADVQLRVAACDAARSVLNEHRQKVLSGKLSFAERRHYVRSFVRAIHVRPRPGPALPEVEVELAFEPPAQRYCGGSPGRKGGVETVSYFSNPVTTG